MKKSILFVLITAISYPTISQVFPLPQNHYGYASYDSVYLFWSPPDGKDLSHYNIYFYACEGGVTLALGSTTKTSYTIPMPTFAHSANYGITAAYLNPDGESDTAWVGVVCPVGWEFPTYVDFEDEELYQCGMVANITRGTDNWAVTDTVFYSSSHSAVFYSDSVNYSSTLITTGIAGSGILNPAHTLRCRIPTSNGLSDTLKMYYEQSGQWIEYGEPLFALEAWQFIENQDTLPDGFRFAFKAISGGGGGIFLDDLNFYEEVTGIEDVNTSPPIISVFPNPATSIISITINNISGPRQLVLHSMDGNPLETLNPIKIAAGNTLILDISDLPAGIYFLSIAGEDQSITEKIIKL